MYNRAYGKCTCGMWTSVLKSTFPELTKKTKRCNNCTSIVAVWYVIKDARVWYKPWTWNYKWVVCQSYNNGWSSQSLPKELWGI